MYPPEVNLGDMVTLNIVRTGQFHSECCSVLGPTLHEQEIQKEKHFLELLLVLQMEPVRMSVERLDKFKRYLQIIRWWGKNYIETR